MSGDGAGDGALGGGGQTGANGIGDLGGDTEYVDLDGDAGYDGRGGDAGYVADSDLAAGGRTLDAKLSRRMKLRSFFIARPRSPQSTPGRYQGLV